MTRPSGSISDNSSGAQTKSGLVGPSSILLGSLLPGNIINKHGVDIQVVAGRLFLIHLSQRPQPLPVGLPGRGMLISLRCFDRQPFVASFARGLGNRRVLLRRYCANSRSVSGDSSMLPSQPPRSSLTRRCRQTASSSAARDLPDQATATLRCGLRPPSPREQDLEP